MQPIGRIQRAFPSTCGANYRENEDLLLPLELVAANLAEWRWRDGVSLCGLACFCFARGRALVTAQAPRRRFRGLACGERAGEHPASQPHPRFIGAPTSKQIIRTGIRLGNSESRMGVEGTRTQGSGVQPGDLLDGVEVSPRACRRREIRSVSMRPQWVAWVRVCG
jgi:hypothetical protein